MSTQTRHSSPGLLSPFQHSDFRRVWLASLPSNFGTLINAVGASWAMTELSDRADMVALVQTAMMLPFMLFAIPAGAIADTYDRRKIAIYSLSVATIFSLALFLTSWFNLLTPMLLLGLCFLIGTANAVFGPTWMSSAGEQLPRDKLPLGIALNAMSFNVARSAGPALGGVAVAIGGAVTAFAANALSYIPMIFAQYLWRRERDNPRLPPEQVGTAVISGTRYVLHSPPLRRSIVRTLLFGLSGAAIQALLPLIASSKLAGEASTYGILLGTFGVGAVLGSASIAWVRARMNLEMQTRSGLFLLGLSTAGISLSSSMLLTSLSLLLGGFAWMWATNALNVSIQTRAPRWVAGRAVATFQAAIAGGLAIGSWMWGAMAENLGLDIAMSLSAAALAIVAIIGTVIPVAPFDDQDDGGSARLADPDIELELTGRSGPIVVTVEYDVPPEKAREFYDAMTVVRGIRVRNGAYSWSLSRDVGASNLWLERFQTPTWHDYLRQRERLTMLEQQQIDDLILRLIAEPIRIRRLLERPAGSVRWRDDSRDPGITFPTSSGN